MARVDQETADLALLGVQVTNAVQEKLEGRFGYARRMHLADQLEKMAHDLRKVVSQRVADDLPREPFSDSGP